MSDICLQYFSFFTDAALVALCSLYLPGPVQTESSTPALSSLSAPSASHHTPLQAGLPFVLATQTHTQ